MKNMIQFLSLVFENIRAQNHRFMFSEAGYGRENPYYDFYE